MLLVYTTLPSQQEAQILAKKVLEADSAACANILPQINSLYFWEGELQSQQECAVLFKTLPGKKDLLIELIESLHPYQTPAIIVLPAQTNASFHNYMVQILT